jgi:hypothetical protein
MRFACFIGLLIVSISLFSQSKTPLSVIESELLSDYNEILTKDPFHRDQLANTFYNNFAEKLTTEGSFEYAFDSLKNIGSIYSQDRSLRIFTWNIPVGLNEQLYFGIAQYYSSNAKNYRIVKLNDPVGLNQIKKIGKWQGALYYEVIQTKHAGRNYYTLLGFSFNNSLSNKKVIDILSIDNFDELYFCKDLIQYKNKKEDRIEFIYNERATMSLRYNEKMKMIIFDHLSPSKPSMEGKYEFYGPDFTYDGFKFEKGTWEYYSDIEITN